MLRAILVLALISSLCLLLSSSFGFEESGGYEYNRAKLLAYILNKDLSGHHFSHKKIDDSISKAAFGLYLKQVDSQKRFLLKMDVEKLRTFSDLIDDELRSGKILFPEEVARILAERTVAVQKTVREILSRDFDFSVDESIETDAEKLDFCEDETALIERWRKILKYQVMQRYLSLLEDEKPSNENSEQRGQKTPDNLQETARRKILKNYDSLFARLLHEKPREYYDRYFSALTRAFDPHTDYMPPTDKEDFDINMRGSLEGIGATLREEDGYIKVVSVVPGGPAYLEGQLDAEDIILRVTEEGHEPVEISDMRVRDAVKLIRGKKGTKVKLSVKKPDGTQKIIPIVRDVVQLEETFVREALLKDDAGKKVFGYIKIPAFYRDFEKMRSTGRGRNSTDDVKEAIRKLGEKRINGLILDLRNNGGGALTDAVKTAGLFIATGPVVQVKASNGNMSVLSDDDPEVHYGGPVIVLVNQLSASASEILAGMLQDYGRAVIIGGEHTHGKGTVQSVIDLDDVIPFEGMEKYRSLGALKLTIQKFYRVSGESTQYRGITPDIILPDRFRVLKSGEQYLEYALPWDTVPPVKYPAWSPDRPDLQNLRSRSLKRVKAKQDFIEINSEISRSLDRQRKTEQSLSLDEARKEREQDRLLKDREGKTAHETRTGTNRQSPEEKRETWIREVSSDAYVREAIAVLNDMLSFLPDLSMN
ncbi:MAG: carboxy terminal-processing peptidase [Nitrospirae bacterium]|nr:carboxy terminal-processing peptidase [Nitrospirota bacterium]